MEQDILEYVESFNLPPYQYKMYVNGKRTCVGDFKRLLRIKFPDINMINVKIIHDGQEYYKAFNRLEDILTTITMKLGRTK